MFDLVKRLVEKYSNLHKNMIRAGGELNISEHSLIRLQDEASDISHLFMRLQDLKLAHSTLIEEIKANGEHVRITKNQGRALGQQYKATTDKNIRPALIRELKVNNERLRNFAKSRNMLWRRAVALDKSIRELSRTIAIKTREFRKTQSKFRDNLRDSEKAIRNIR